MPRRAPKVGKLVAYRDANGHWKDAKVTAVTTPGSVTSIVTLKVGTVTHAAVARQTTRAQTNVWNHTPHGYF